MGSKFWCCRHLLIRPKTPFFLQFKLKQQLQQQGLPASSAAAPVISSAVEEQREHALALDPEDAAFLMETRIRRVRQKRRRRGDDDISVWDYLMTTYTRTYEEKLVLVDREVASGIAGAIAKSKEKSSSGGLFIDADGGFCRITEALQKLGSPGPVFDRYFLYEKDINLLCLSRRASSNYLDPGSLSASPEDLGNVVNISQFPSSFMSSRGEYVSPLYNVVASECHQRATNSETSKPAFTLFGTATHNFVKYLVQRCLQRKDPKFLTEFSLGDGRPEFFLVCTPRTWIHLTSDTPSSWSDSPPQTQVWRLPKNILFQLLFESELLQVLPRKSFFPWKKPKYSTTSLKVVSKQYARLSDRLYLIRVRPKLRTGIDHLDLDDPSSASMESGGAFSSSHILLEYFVHALFRHRQTRLLPMMDVWHSGATLECVRRGLVGVNASTGDLTLTDLVQVFNLLVRQPDLENSSFRFMAEAFNANRFKDHPTTCEETRKNYLKLKRKITKT